MSGARAVPAVTVVVPTKNRRDLLARCLAAIAAQTLPADAYEVVVADNRSTEDIAGLVAEVAARTGRCIRHLPMAEDRGPAPARNAAVRAAAGRVIAFCDSDTEPTPGWLAAGLAAIDGGATIAHGPITPPPGATLPLFTRRSVFAPDGHPTFPTANLFIRRDAFLGAGGFDESLCFLDPLDRAVECADTDLAWRLIDAGHPVSFVRGAEVHHVVEVMSPWRFVVEPTRLVALPLLLRLHPGLRARLCWQPGVYHWASLVGWALLAAALALALVAPRLLPLVPVLLLVTAMARTATLRPGPVLARARYQALVACQLVVMALTLLYASVRFRSVVL